MTSGLEWYRMAICRAAGHVHDDLGELACLAKSLDTIKSGHGHELVNLTAHHVRTPT